MTLRPGGSKASPGPTVVAQAKFAIPASFGQLGLVDISAGASLARFTTLRDAIDGARMLAPGKASLGVVRQPDGAFTVNDLTVPDVIDMQPGWSGVADVPLVVGPDPVVPRTITDLQRLADAPAGNGQLMSVWTRSGNTRYDAVEGAFVLAFNHM